MGKRSITEAQLWEKIKEWSAIAVYEIVGEVYDVEREQREYIEKVLEEHSKEMKKAIAEYSAAEEKEEEE